MKKSVWKVGFFSWSCVFLIDVYICKWRTCLTKWAFFCFEIDDPREYVPATTTVEIRVCIVERIDTSLVKSWMSYLSLWTVSYYIFVKLFEVVLIWPLITFYGSLECNEWIYGTAPFLILGLWNNIVKIKSLTFYLEWSWFWPCVVIDKSTPMGHLNHVYSDYKTKDLNDVKR